MSDSPLLATLLATIEQRATACHRLGNGFAAARIQPFVQLVDLVTFDSAWRSYSPEEQTRLLRLRERMWIRQMMCIAQDRRAAGDCSENELIETLATLQDELEALPIRGPRSFDI